MSWAGVNTTRSAKNRKLTFANKLLDQQLQTTRGFFNFTQRQIMLKLLRVLGQVDSDSRMW